MRAMSDNKCSQALVSQSTPSLKHGTKDQSHYFKTTY